MMKFFAKLVNGYKGVNYFSKIIDVWQGPNRWMYLGSDLPIKNIIF